MLPANLAPDQVQAFQLAYQTLRRHGPIARDRALGFLIDGGFSADQAWRLVVALLGGPIDLA